MTIKQRIVGVPSKMEVNLSKGKSFIASVGFPVKDERIYHFQIYEQYAEEDENLNDERIILTKEITSYEVQKLVTNNIIKIFSFPGYEDKGEESKIEIYEFFNVNLKL